MVNLPCEILKIFFWRNDKLKKTLALVLALVMVLGLAACNSTNSPTAPPAGSPGASNSGSVDIALITDVGNIDDHSFNQGTWEGVKQYADANGLNAQYFRPTEDSDQARVEATTSAIDKGAKVVVYPGFLFGPCLTQMQTAYPNVMFLGIDMNDDATAGKAGDGTIAAATANTTLIVFQEEQAGYLAGYAAVSDGYKQLGFMGGINVPAVVRYGYGFIQGADQASADLGLAKGAVTIQYWYAGGFAPTDDIKNMANAWYTAGTQVIFSCGGGIYSSIVAAAQSANAKVIGVDVDQATIDPCIITSAMKGLGVAVVKALTDLYANNGTWPSAYAGKCQNLGAKDDAVGLPTAPDSWRLTTYTVDDYNTLYAKLVSGEIVVNNSSDPNTMPTTNLVTVNPVS